MTLVDHDQIQYYEKDLEVGLHFPNGVDPKMLMDAIKEMDE